MIIDTSALIAILFDEPEALTFIRLVDAAGQCRMSAACYLEAAIIIDSNNDAIASRDLDNFVDQSGIIIEPDSASQARVARQAYRDFGKRSNSRAKLNFGDCFAYALAKERAEALLFKGEDFIHTDVAVAALP